MDPSQNFREKIWKNAPAGKPEELYWKRSVSSLSSQYAMDLWTGLSAGFLLGDRNQAREPGQGTRFRLQHNIAGHFTGWRTNHILNRCSLRLIGSKFNSKTITPNWLK